MAKKSKRVDVQGEAESLTHNPFGPLRGTDVPDAPAPPPDEPRESGDASPSYRVGRTRKGGFALSIERRPGGKVVTVLDNVEGDVDALLRLLRKRCGAGGALREGALELQGDHRERIETILREEVG